MLIWLVTAAAISSSTENAVPPVVNWAAVVAAFVAFAGVVYRTWAEGKTKEKLTERQHNFEQSMRDRESTTQARLAQQAELLKPQLEAFRKLWSLMIVASPTLVPPVAEKQRSVQDSHSRILKLRSWKRKDGELSLEKRQDLANELRKWYYEGGNGIFLSNEARDLLVYAQGELKDDKVTYDEVVRTLSLLRTQTKNDVGVYGQEPLRVMSLVPTNPEGEAISAEGLALLRHGPSFSNQPQLRVKMKAKVPTDATFRVYVNNADAGPATDMTIETCKNEAGLPRHSTSGWGVLPRDVSPSELNTVEIRYLDGDKAGTPVLEYRSE